MKKKVVMFLSVAVCLILSAFCLAGCGGKKPEEKPGGENNGGGTQTPGEYTVVFDANGGKFTDDWQDGLLEEATLSDDKSKITLMTKSSDLFAPTVPPERDRYAFSGWAKDSDGQTLWDFETDALTGNITLYAVWSVTFDFALSEDKSYYTVRGLGGLSGDVEIPNMYNRKPVTEIAKNAFAGSQSLTSIVVPDGVTEIGEAAFKGCNNLVSAEIGEGARKFPENMFAGCYKLEKVYVPLSVEKFDRSVFGDLGQTGLCDLLTEVHYAGTVDDWCGIEVYDTGDFCSSPLANGVAKLYINDEPATDITINVEKVKIFTFCRCKTIENITIGENVKEIALNAFRNSGVKTLKFASGANLTTIGETAFYNSAITSLALPDSLEHIGKQAFYGCNKLDSVDLGGAKYVEEEAFSGSFKISDLNLGKAEEIGRAAFGNCKITSLTIPDTVWHIGEYAFGSCDDLTSVTFASNASGASWQRSYKYGNNSIKTETVTSATLSSVSTAATKLKDSIEWVRLAGMSFSEYNNEYTVKGVSGNSYGALIIPATYNGKPVTAIGYGAFENFKELKSVTMPNSIKSIGTMAFSGCSSLTSVTIGNGVTSIESDAFSGCNNISEIRYAGDIASWCGIIEIRNLMFYGTSNKKLYINNTEITGALVIPSGVTSIWQYAFSGCSSLTSITIPNSVTSIGGGAFRGCSSLTSVTIGNGVTSIGYQAFYGCSSLTSITIPSSVTRIGYQAFYGCSSLTSIEIPSGVTYIEERTFENCSSLTSVTIGSGVTSIERSAFQGCSNIDEIRYMGDIASWCGISGLGDLMYKGKKNRKLYINGTEITGALIIPNSVTSIGEGAFYGCSNLTSVEIPNGVTSIGGRAFRGCSSLTSVEIPNSVTSIGDYAFADCSSLASITIPNGVTSVEVGTFEGCSSLTSIEIPNSVMSIGDSAFRSCSSLTSIEISNGVTSIGDRAFSGCKSLTSIEIPNGVTSIGEWAFECCSSLTSIEIPSSVMKIKYNAFQGCSNIDEIRYMGDIASWCGISGLGDLLYNGKNNKKLYINGTEITGAVVIPNGVTSIGSNAFSGCSSLTSITIPSSVTSIGGGAFSGCSSLTIYCEAASKPSGWNNNWNPSNRPVVWDYKNT